MTDIDECENEKNPCDHNCTDTDGSYTCSCDSGYTLNEDKHTCAGKASRIVPKNVKYFLVVKFILQYRRRVKYSDILPDIARQRRTKNQKTCVIHI